MSWSEMHLVTFEPVTHFVYRHSQLMNIGLPAFYISCFILNTLVNFSLTRREIVGNRLKFTCVSIKNTDILLALKNQELNLHLLPKLKQ